MATEHRSAAKTIPHFTPRHRFATFALRLRPFGSFFRDGAPVCNENDSPLHPQAWIRNFCSTSGPVWLRFSRRSTGLQRKRCVSAPSLGPEFSRRSTGLRRKRCFFSPSFGPERKSSFRCRPHGFCVFRRKCTSSPSTLAGSGSGARGALFFTTTGTLKKYPLLGKNIIISLVL